LEAEGDMTTAESASHNEEYGNIHGGVREELSRSFLKLLSLLYSLREFVTTIVTLKCKRAEMENVWWSWADGS
jgi:hypothetical protein